MTLSIIMAMELFPTEGRTFAGNVIEFFWVGGLISITPFAYFIRNWRYLVLATSGPCCLTVLLFW